MVSNPDISIAGRGIIKSLQRVEMLLNAPSMSKDVLVKMDFYEIFVMFNCKNVFQALYDCL